jgi:hypothetical protein
MLTLKDFSQEFRKMAEQKDKERVEAAERFWKAVEKAKRNPEKKVIGFTKLPDQSLM